MTSNRFDEISRMFAGRRLTRRQALVTGGTGLAVSLAATGRATTSATPEPGTGTPRK